ncbi:hypothetical protein HPK16_15425 [Listeria sp. W9-0585]|uniref:Uncharacterized protein n=1 Tax=Listeria rustica TaxID=2713503 RepID=A0A7W1T913_9LIST|nr:hypothetical protein [Listeria rustica]
MKSHVYYDYIDPLIKIFSDGRNANMLFQYLSEEKIEAFMSEFKNKMEDCLGSVGWPFNKMESMGYFVHVIFNSATDHSKKKIQLICMEILWELAADCDRWKIQDIVVSIIENNKLIENNDIQLALIIDASSKKFDKLQSISSEGIESVPLRNAIFENRMLDEKE